MLRRIVSNFYRRLPVVRELQALVHEHQKITTSLLHIENYLKAGQAIRLLDFDLRDHPRYADPLRLLC
ncbi:MAG TPA: hypothetical protein VH229_01730, partial [Candidatus Udaeobacter sp.]|nr:hypothetical protein [Candidatus Udaeobacter sp.]